jgi:hypothetical protein
MELASLLGGERFSDRPAAVCPVIAAIMRAYNDVVDDERRQELYPHLSDCVGSRGCYALERRRAQRALAFARARYAAMRFSPRRVRGRRAPDFEDGPDALAAYVIGSLRRRQAGAEHRRILSLIQDLIAMGPEPDRASSCASPELQARRRLTPVPTADALVPGARASATRS